MKRCVMCLDSSQFLPRLLVKQLIKTMSRHTSGADHISKGNFDIFEPVIHSEERFSKKKVM